MIRIKNLVKTYNERPVVDISDLFIPAGEIYGIVGGNGSGKTTLLKMIAQLEVQDSGLIEHEIALNEMVYLFQKPHLFNTSVYNNIAHPLKFRKIPDGLIKEKVEGILRDFDLVHLKDMNAKKLSGGESQKVNLARALVFEPRLILLDEPTANIDPVSTMQLEAILKGVMTRKKINMVLVTHNIPQAKRLCDHMTFLKKGQVLMSGETDKILGLPELQYI